MRTVREIIKEIKKAGEIKPAETIKDFNMNTEVEKILKIPGLLCLWDFQEEPGTDRIAKGPYPYRLKEMEGPFEKLRDGALGEYSVRLTEGKWFKAPRADSAALDIHGKKAEVTLLAWVKREKKSKNECEAIAGIWNEENNKRQYGLFLNLAIHNSSQQVCGHISSVGGPTLGQNWCIDASIGATPVPYGEWQCIGFSYDGEYAKSYLNGKLDTRNFFNPYHYNEGIYDNGAEGSDFTVGGVYRTGEMGNWYTGLLGGLAVFNRALNEEEIASIGWIC